MRYRGAGKSMGAPLGGSARLSPRRLPPPPHTRTPPRTVPEDARPGIRSDSPLTHPAASVAVPPWQATDGLIKELEAALADHAEAYVEYQTERLLNIQARATLASAMQQCFQDYEAAILPQAEKNEAAAEMDQS